MQLELDQNLNVGTVQLNWAEEGLQLELKSWVPADDVEQSFAEPNERSRPIRVPVTKASEKDTPAFIDIDLDSIPTDAFREIFLQGLKHFVNSKMTKFTGKKTEASKKQVMEVAKENVKDIYNNRIRMTAGTRTKVSGAVKTEALRQAKLIVKSALKDAGYKVSHIKAREITAMAEEYLAGEYGPELMKQAQAEVALREAKKKNVGNIINLKDVKVDPELVRKDEAKKASRKKEPSAAEAAAVLAKAKPGVQQVTRH